MKRLGTLLALAVLAQPSLAQPISSTLLASPLMLEWGESTAPHGGDCTSSDLVANEVITTVFDNDAGGLEFGQSFTAPCSGAVESVSFVVYNTGSDFPSDTATLDLLFFGGAGTAGPLLASEHYTVSVPMPAESGQVHAVAFPASPGVEAGQTYTFFLDQIEGDIQLLASNSSAYPGGGMYFTEDGDPASASPALGHWDLTFRIHLLPPTPTASEPAPSGTYDVSSVYPNPLRDSGRFSLLLDMGQHVRIAAMDLLGREVALLHDGPLPAARHGFDLRSNGWPNGVYIVTVRGEAFSSTQKVVVAR